MKAPIASVLAGAFGILIIQVPGLYIAAMAISIALSLLTAVFSFVSAKSNNLQETRTDRPFFVLSGLFAAGTALAGAFRLRGLTNVIPVSAGLDLLGWLLAASLTIALPGAALVVSSAKPTYSVT